MEAYLNRNDGSSFMDYVFKQYPLKYKKELNLLLVGKTSHGSSSDERRLASDFLLRKQQFIVLLLRCNKY